MNCSRCKKRIAVVFITRVEDGKTKMTGFAFNVHVSLVSNR